MTIGPPQTFPEKSLLYAELRSSIVNVLSNSHFTFCENLNPGRSISRILSQSTGDCG